MTAQLSSKERCFHSELRRDRHDETDAYLDVWYCPEPQCDFEVNLCKHNNQRQGEHGLPYCADCGAQVPESLRPAPETPAIVQKAAQHWLDLQRDIPIAWEGGIDAAMLAACNEIRRLSATQKASAPLEEWRKAGAKIAEAIPEGRDAAEGECERNAPNGPER